jgi:hypothetical protein
MWLFTVRGMYSAVQKPEDRKDNLMTIRARNKAHLENLADLLPTEVPDGCYTEPLRDPGHDYPWRIRLPKADWMKIHDALGEEIDYDNFKSEVARRTGYGKYEHALHDVWAVMERVGDLPAYA